MFHYSPSSRSQGYTSSYLPRRSYFPASFDIDDAPSPAYGLEDLGYPSLSQSFLPPRIDAEARYRRALYELEAAEQEYQGHIALERARQATAIRQRAAAEAAHREREIALFAEIERIKRTHALQEQVEERLSQRERAVRTQVAFDRARCGRHPFMRLSMVMPREIQFLKVTLLVLKLTLFTTTSAAEPHTQPQPPKHENTEVNLSNILEFFQGIAAQARGVAGGSSLLTRREGQGQSQGRALPELLFLKAYSASVQDRDTTDVKKHTLPRPRSPAPEIFESEGRGSIFVGPRSVSHSYCICLRRCSRADFAPHFHRAVRTQFSALESEFKFPSILDFDYSELASTSNNAPRLDAIESDGNEEVRDVRREVVREVERALEEVERKVKEQALRALVPEVAKQQASDVESDDPSAPVTQAVPPVAVHVTEAAKPTMANLAPTASQADADVDVAISREYQSASPVATPSGVAVAERDSVAGASPANEDTEAVPASEDASDSIVTITPGLLLLPFLCQFFEQIHLFSSGRRDLPHVIVTQSVLVPPNPHFLSRLRTQEFHTTTMS
ncbi:hypothetical protein BGY98DRAFT_1181634 [Russula aff. rugulosa BPL654]|nr:hypothetical protein BGY98DRAFT_1181634 [Russula aff. rugulosa BPL654]